MLKDKHLTECSRDKWIAAQKRDAEQKQRFRHVKKPTNKDKFH